MLLVLAMAAVHAAEPVISGQGEKLARHLDSMDVEHLWLAHQRVDWATGKPVGPSADPEHSTHCSAFVAAACGRLGVPILHPPEHPQKLLSNAQHDWLKEKGANNGWKQLADGFQAQEAANSGSLVVAVFKNPSAEHPGHIAIVRPSLKSAAQLEEDGPDIIQAGGHNYRQTSVRHGFANHPRAFQDAQILYFLHPL